jgi:hypothetical protein
MVQHMWPFLWSIFILTKKFKTFGARLIREKNFWTTKKKTCSRPYFKCFKHTKGLWKHCKFASNFCGWNFATNVNFSQLKKQFLELWCFHGGFANLHSVIILSTINSLNDFFLTFTWHVTSLLGFLEETQYKMSPLTLCNGKQKQDVKC